MVGLQALWIPTESEQTGSNLALALGAGEGWGPRPVAMVFTRLQGSHCLLFHQLRRARPPSSCLSLQVTNRGEAHLELNAFRRKHDCALVISGDSLEVGTGTPASRLLPGAAVWEGPWPTHHLSLIPARFASSTTSTSSWSWPASARPWSAAAARPPRRPRSYACSRSARGNSRVQ